MAYKKKNGPISGFTLIELLVVIAIIGVLASVVLASLKDARGSAMDAKRLADMRTIQTALELYRTKHGLYPSSNLSGCGGWESTGSDTSGNFVAALVADGSLSGGLKEPDSSLDDSCGNYAYYRYSAGSSGCDRAFYVIGVRQTNSSGTSPHPTSPGWSCPGRNWQSEFSWVTGGFE